MASIGSFGPWYGLWFSFLDTFGGSRMLPKFRLFTKIVAVALGGHSDASQRLAEPPVNPWSTARRSFASEEPPPKCLIALMCCIQNLCKLRFLTQRLQQGVGSEIGIREEPAFHSASQDSKRGHLGPQDRVRLCNLVCRFGVT